MNESRGMRPSTENDGTRSTADTGPTLEEPELLSFRDNAYGDQEVRDRSTGSPLNPEMVKKARELEMQCMEDLKVLEDSDRDAFMAETGRPPIPTDWVSTSTKVTLSDPTKEAGSSVKRHVDDQRLMRKIGQQRVQQLLRTRRSVCS